MVVYIKSNSGLVILLSLGFPILQNLVDTSTQKLLFQQKNELYIGYLFIASNTSENNCNDSEQFNKHTHITFTLGMLVQNLAKCPGFPLAQYKCLMKQTQRLHC